jgi:urease accessory protein
MDADLVMATGNATADGFARSLLPLVRLLQLASPTLPIGAYSYSQGLEWAVESGDVRDAASARVWIGDVLELVVAPGEAAVAWRLLAAARRADWPMVATWNAWFRASRETAELRAETEQTGGSLARLLRDLDLLDAPAAAIFSTLAPITLPAAYALAVRAFGLAADAPLRRTSGRGSKTRCWRRSSWCRWARSQDSAC